jgi:hypothetical protein
MSESGVPRRAIGLAVVAVTFLVFVVVGAVRGRVVRGEPVAQPVASPPAVGDCVLGNPHELDVGLYNWAPALPSVETGPCSGSRYGEVVLVFGDFVAAKATLYPAENPYDKCIRGGDEYLAVPARLPFDGGFTVQPPVSDPVFAPAANVFVAFFGPDARQRAAGQAWAACVIYLPTAVDGRTPLMIDHPLQGAWLRIPDNQLFALCIDDIAEPVAADCHVPHRFELIGMAWGTTQATPEFIDAACRSTAIEALGSSAALDSGALTAQVVAVRPDPENEGALIVGPGAVSSVSTYLDDCLLTTTDTARRLTGSLRGLGDAPVPMT